MKMCVFIHEITLLIMVTMMMKKKKKKKNRSHRQDINRTRSGHAENIRIFSV